MPVAFDACRFMVHSQIRARGSCCPVAARPARLVVVKQMRPGIRACCAGSIWDDRETPCLGTAGGLATADSEQFSHSGADCMHPNI